MPSPKPKIRHRKAKKRKGKVKIRESVYVRRKSEEKKDAMPKAPFIMNDNGLNMRIKIKRKSR